VKHFEATSCRTGTAANKGGKEEKQDSPGALQLIIT
jgi:hypothetical protein